MSGCIAAIFGGWDAALATELQLFYHPLDLSKLEMDTEDRTILNRMLIVVAVRIDILLNSNYVRDTVCIAFCCNELISILENAGLMGIQLPDGLKSAIDLLQKKAGVDEKTDEKENDDNDNSET